MTRLKNQEGERIQPIPRATQLQFYERMVLIRRFELRVQRLYRDGKIPGFIHLCVGEEATAVGVCANLSQEDVITSTHRGHGHALAKGLSLQRVLAELAGRSAGDEWTGRRRHSGLGGSGPG